MEEATELEDPNDKSSPTAVAAGGDTNGAPLTPRREARRQQLAAEFGEWNALNCAELRAALREAIAGSRAASPEALTHLCRRAVEAGDRQTLNLAFEALSKKAAPLLFSQAWGLTKEDRRDQVQEVLLKIFAAIQNSRTAYAESNFAGFAKRRAIELYRARQARWEGANRRIEPTETVDPMDKLPARLPSQEAQALLARSLDALSPKHRAAFIQYHHFGMTQEEIADQHEVDVRTVYNWLKKADSALGLSGDQR